MEEVYDFEHGDVLHIRSWSIDMGIGAETRTILKYLGRTEINDTITYLVEVNTAGFSVQPFAEYTQTSASTDTIYQYVSTNPEFDAVPQTPIIGQYDGVDSYAWFYDMAGSELRVKSVNEGKTITGSGDGNCWSEIFDGFCPTHNDNRYIEGLGGPYRYCEYGAAYSSGTELANQLP